MSLGLASFVFFIIAFPGIIFRRFYYTGEFSKQFLPKNPIIPLFFSVLTGVFIVFVSIFFYNILLCRILSFGEITIQKLISIISQFKYTDKTEIDLYVSKTLNWVFSTTNLIKITTFITVVFINSFVFAKITYYTIRFFKIDKRWSVFKFSNYWFYYLRGEFISFKDFGKIKYKKIDAVYADVLVEIPNDKPQLYSGTLKQYQINKETSQLETLFLNDVVRYKRYRKGNVVTKKIPSHCFTIPYKRVLNLNLFVAYEEKGGKKPKSTLLKIGLIIVLTLLTLALFFPYSKPIVDSPIIAKILLGMLLLIGWIFVLNQNKESDKKTDNKEKTNDLAVAFSVLCVVFLLLYLLISNVTNWIVNLF